MKSKYEPNKRKAIREIQTRKNYGGEASPYWDFLKWKTIHDESDGLTEHPLANPDVLSADETMHDRVLTARGELQLEAVQTVLPTLTTQQRKAVELCGERGHTEEMAATILGIKRRTLRTILSRVRDKVRREYDRLLKLEG